MFKRNPDPSSISFRPGDVVEVRSHKEILATLDADGCLEGLPFMPEMVRHCGGRYRVLSRAEKVYLDVRYEVRRLNRTVLLEGLRCDGSAHDGCQMGCLLLWKEAWLRPAREKVPSPEGGPPLISITLPTSQGDRFFCQATALAQATTRLPWWDLRPYVRDLFGGERSLLELLRMMRIAVSNKIRWLGGLPLLGTITGPQTKTPEECLDLQPGELVQVKSFEEIVATLDASGRNRGLAFASDMARYCGGTYRVARRVDRAVIEWSGQMRPIRNTVALEGVTCSGIEQRCCPRRCYHLWREIWLRRVDDTSRRAGVGPPTGIPLFRTHFKTE